MCVCITPQVTVAFVHAILNDGNMDKSPSLTEVVFYLGETDKE